ARELVARELAVPVAFARTLLCLGALAGWLCAAAVAGPEAALRDAVVTLGDVRVTETAWSPLGGAPREGVAPAPALLTWQPQEAPSWSLANVQDDGDAYFPSCDACPRRGLVAFVSYDSWRGIADGGWQNNGIVSGANYGTRLGRFSDWTGFG